ncbi:MULTISPECIES: anthranilate synthase component I family protein [unclassified Curtobacterium]|uniref:anthranilate synthase component I family protein n=1 Tax=unclassified Curtobacterium TaxID=257496 RepID=UPI001043AF8C|nr:MULTISPECIES: anthranilate synthase component I family protein [unclassified Curtobacterium]TCU51081.1 anthranilate synthase component 1/para-aminobenzoate synthetase [Curtobacterium sp. PhB146]TCU86754.1 anthranilate synthase component 1/para-aminobenzoate synthetase [Curtobacterium sp. PhB191]
MDDLRDLTGPSAGARIEVRRLDPVPDLGALAAAVEGDLVWLDSALPDGAPDAARPRARWSVLTWADGPFRARFRHQDRQASVEVAAPAAGWFGSSSSDDRPAFTVLADLLARTPQLPEPIAGCGFALGWVGFLGYELGRESGGPDRTADGHADADLRFVDRAVVVDHTGGAWALTLVADAEPAASAQNRAWLETVTRSPSTADVADAATGLPAGVSSAVGRTSRADHERAVDACRAEIREGNAFQVCLTTSFSVPGRGREARVGPGTDPHLSEYLRMRASDPVPFGAYLRLGPLRVASRSPERFLRIAADRTVLAEPIKGTRRRLADAAADAAVRDELAVSAKDRAENVMIVDLLRNDLLRTAIPGSVHVERLCAVETYASVHQMVSTIGAVLPSGTSPADVVRAAFPPGSMTGAPKISAMAIADRLEGAPRGVYSGTIGYFSASGAVDLSVVIRTLVTVVDASGGGVGPVEVRSRTLGAGGAVTWSSVAADEADEVVTKTRSVLGAVGAVATW